MPGEGDLDFFDSLVFADPDPQELAASWVCSIREDEEAAGRADLVFEDGRFLAEEEADGRWSQTRPDAAPQGECPDVSRDGPWDVASWEYVVDEASGDSLVVPPPDAAHLTDQDPQGALPLPGELLLDGAGHGDLCEFSELLDSFALVLQAGESNHLLPDGGTCSNGVLADGPCGPDGQGSPRPSLLTSPAVLGSASIANSGNEGPRHSLSKVGEVERSSNLAGAQVADASTPHPGHFAFPGESAFSPGQSNILGGAIRKHSSSTSSGSLGIRSGRATSGAVASEVQGSGSSQSMSHSNSSGSSGGSCRSQSARDVAACAGGAGAGAGASARGLTLLAKLKDLCKNNGCGSSAKGVDAPAPPSGVMSAATPAMPGAHAVTDWPGPAPAPVSPPGGCLPPTRNAAAAPGPKERSPSECPHPPRHVAPSPVNGPVAACGALEGYACAGGVGEQLLAWSQAAQWPVPAASKGEAVAGLEVGKHTGESREWAPAGLLEYSSAGVGVDNASSGDAGVQGRNCCKNLPGQHGDGTARRVEEAEEVGNAEEEHGDEGVASDEGTGADADEKQREKRLLRNRQSASQSRQRRKQYVTELEQRCRFLEVQVSQMRQVVAMTALENGALRDELIRMQQLRQQQVQGDPVRGEGVVCVSRGGRSSRSTSPTELPSGEEDRANGNAFGTAKIVKAVGPCAGRSNIKSPADYREAGSQGSKEMGEGVAWQVPENGREGGKFGSRGVCASRGAEPAALDSDSLPSEFLLPHQRQLLGLVFLTLLFFLLGNNPFTVACAAAILSLTSLWPFRVPLAPWLGHCHGCPLLLLAVAVQLLGGRGGEVEWAAVSKGRGKAVTPLLQQKGQSPNWTLCLVLEMGRCLSGTAVVNCLQERM